MNKTSVGWASVGVIGILGCCGLGYNNCTCQVGVGLDSTKYCTRSRWKR